MTTSKKPSTAKKTTKAAVVATKKPVAAKKASTVKKPAAAKKPLAAKKTSAAKKPAMAKKLLAAKKPKMDSAVNLREFDNLSILKSQQKTTTKKIVATNKKPSTSKKTSQKTELSIILKQLETLKAESIQIFEAEGKSYLFDQMVVCTSRSKAHGNATLEKVREALKAHGFQPHAMEGDSDSEWRLLDAGSVIVHVMTREAREHFDLESLWGAAGAMRD